MLSPNREGVVILVIGSEVKIVEEIAFESGDVGEVGKFQIPFIGFRRRNQIVAGLFHNMSSGDHEENNR